MNFKFENLLGLAFEDWPVDIDLSDIQYSKDDVSKYSIKGLGVMADIISEKYIGSPEEVLFRNLHQSIYSTLHVIAPNALSIRISCIRPASVKIRFEKHLKTGMHNPEIGYSKDDILICERYFNEN